MVYEKDRTVRDIPALRFQAPPSMYDTTLPDNAGYRYANVEKVNYYPNWPNCPNNTAASPPQSCATANLDCTVPDNYCHQCCNGSKINDTYQLPPGMFPLKCFPGPFHSFLFDIFENSYFQERSIMPHLPQCSPLLISCTRPMWSSTRSSEWILIPTSIRQLCGISSRYHLI